MILILRELQSLHYVYNRDYEDGYANRQELNAVIRALREIEKYHFGEKRTKEVTF